MEKITRNSKSGLAGFVLSLAVPMVSFFVAYIHSSGFDMSNHGGKIIFLRPVYEGISIFVFLSLITVYFSINGIKRRKYRKLSIAGLIITLLISIALIVFFIGMYVYGDKDDNDKLNFTSPVADWQVYENRQHGIMLKYPLLYKICEETESFFCIKSENVQLEKLFFGDIQLKISAVLDISKSQSYETIKKEITNNVQLRNENKGSLSESSWFDEFKIKKSAVIEDCHGISMFVSCDLWAYFYDKGKVVTANYEFEPYYDGKFQIKEILSTIKFTN